MRDYIIRRLVLLIPLLIGITLFLFILTNVILNPVTIYIRNPQLARNIDAISASHGFDKPIWERYFVWISRLIRGDWGVAVSNNNRPVLASIAQFFPATVELTIAAMFFNVGLGIPTGIISATKKDKPIDQATRIVALSGISLPTFWLGLILVGIFSFGFHNLGYPYLPDQGAFSTYCSLDAPVPTVTGLSILDTIITGRLDCFSDAVQHLVLPAITLGFVGFGVLTRIVRASMLEVLRQDYITLARSKGLSERIVIYKHALRNAMIPTLTLIGLFFAGLLGGAVITETIFQWPGIGRFAVNAALLNDVDALLGFTILIAIIYVLANLIVDVMYAWVDPRIRLT